MGAIGAIDPHLFKKVLNREESTSNLDLINSHFPQPLKFWEYMQTKVVHLHAPNEQIYKFFGNLIQQEKFSQEKDLIINLAYKLQPSSRISSKDDQKNLFEQINQQNQVNQRS